MLCPEASEVSEGDGSLPRPDSEAETKSFQRLATQTQADMDTTTNAQVLPSRTGPDSVSTIEGSPEAQTEPFEAPIKTEVKKEEMSSELSEEAEPMEEAETIKKEIGDHPGASDSVKVEKESKESKKDAKQESECRLCLALNFPVQARLFTDARRRRGHVCAHWEAEGGTEAGSGVRLLERHNGATATVWFRRLLFSAFPAAEAVATMPAGGRKSLLLGTVPSDLTARGWDWDGRAAMPPPKDRPRTVPSRQLRRENVADPSLFHFCTDCGRAVRKATKDGGGGSPVEHVLTAHQTELFVRCPVEGCGFGDSFYPRKVKQHIASAHADRTGLAPVDGRARRWPEIRPLAERLFPDYFGPGTKRALCPPKTQVSGQVTFPARQLRREDVTDPSLYNFCTGCDRVMRKDGGKTLHHVLAHHQTALFVLCPVAGCGFGDRGRRRTVLRHIAQVHPDQGALEPVDERAARWAEILPLAAELFPTVYGKGKTVVRPKQGSKEPTRRDNCDKPELYHFCALCDRGFRRDGGSGAIAHALRHQERLYVRCPVEDCAFGDQGSLAAVRRHIAEAHPGQAHLAPLDDRSSQVAEVTAQVLRCFPSRKRKRFNLYPAADGNSGLSEECALCQTKVAVFARQGKAYALSHAVRRHVDTAAVRCLACGKGFHAVSFFRQHVAGAHEGGADFKESRAEVKRLGFTLARLCFPSFDELRWITTKPKLPAGGDHKAIRRLRQMSRKDKPGADHRRCLRCQMRVPKAQLASHALRHFPLGAKAFRCSASACAYQTNLRVLATRHVRFAHRGQGARVQSNSDATGKAQKACFRAKAAVEKETEELISVQRIKCLKCDCMLERRGPGRLYHALRHLGLKPLSCSYCDSYSSDYSAEINQHIETEHGGEVGVKLVSSFDHHRKRIAEFRREFFSETEVKVQVGPKSERNLKKAKNAGKPCWQCLKCDSVVTFSSRLGHVRMHLKLGEYSCPKCPKQFYTLYEARRHSTVEHAGGSEDPPPEPVSNYCRSKDHLEEFFRTALPQE